MGSHARQGEREMGKLTDNELDVIAGKRDQLVGALKETYGMQKEMAEREIDAWASALKG
jgi:uncharacterized protein YjbJ (UPF0337 family)